MSKPNFEAKKERHQKLYEGQYHSFAGKLWFHFTRVVRALLVFLTPSRRKFSHFMHPLDHMPAPRRLYVQLSTWSLLLLVLMSLNLNQPIYTGYADYQADYLAIETDPSHIADDDGFLIKSSPLEGTAIYDQNRVENVTHEVQSGDTLSTIAYRYGLEIATIRYANPDLANSDRLKPGQNLTIPPKDGIYIKVSSGDSLVALVEKYKGDVEATKTFNEIEDDGDLVAGKEIFVMGGEPLKPVYIATTPKGGSGGYNPNGASSYDNAPANPGGWVRPTSGGITQGYHSGHLAYDIADSSRPPIYAAAGGTVVHASSGTWGGGYGNNIIIDHGNGYKTLYAHCTELYVQEGEEVTQGQVIAKMGNTGNVRGRTGIHLHFELIYNGVKINPSNIGVW